MISLMFWTGIIVPGVAAGQHFGVLAGVGTSCALWVLAPWRPKR